MQWNSFSEFIRMGGYGPYVWSSYGVTFVLLIAEILMIRARRRRLARMTVRGELEPRSSERETLL